MRGAIQRKGNRMGEKPTGVTDENQGDEPGVIGGDGDSGSEPAESPGHPGTSTFPTTGA
jgi:hypothetical protein